MQKVGTWASRHIACGGTRVDECPVHGAYDARKLTVCGREIWTTCPHCSAEARARETALRVESARREMQEARLQQALGQSAIPPRFVSKTLESFQVKTDEQRGALDVCQRFVKNWASVQKDGGCMVLLGKPGTGKTHLACGVALELLKRGHSAVYTRAALIAQTVKETFGRSDRTERDVYEGFADSDLLVIDEVGRQYGTDSEKLMLFEVINLRYERMKPTVVVSNLEPGSFQSYMGSAVLSRLVENGKTVLLEGKNQRFAFAEQ